MEVEGRVGTERGNDGHAGLDDKPHDKAEQVVDAFADDEVLGRETQMGRKRALQGMVFRIVVFPDLARLFGDGRKNRGRRAKTTFIGADPGAHRKAALPLDGFGADKWHGCRKGGGKRREAGKCGHCEAGSGRSMSIRSQ